MWAEYFCRFRKSSIDFLVVIYYKKVAKSYRLKVIDHKSFGCDFPTGSKKATVFGATDPFDVCFHQSHTQKALPCVKTRRLNHQPSILVQAFDLWTCARKKGREGNKGQMDNALKRDRSVILHACAEKFPDNRLLPKFAHTLKKPTLSPVQNLVPIGFWLFHYRLSKKCPFPIQAEVTITTACTSVQP